MSTKRIVITGGPGTGKTMLVTALEQEGFFCFHEVIRDMTLEAKNGNTENLELVNPIAFVEDSKSFNEKLLQLRLAQFHKANNPNVHSYFYDRGMPDVLAYMDYFGQVYEPSYQELCAKHRYDQILILPPWKEIYVQDNERMENFEQATAIHEHLENTYRSLGYDIIKVPFGTVTERLQFVKESITLGR